MVKQTLKTAALVVVLLATVQAEASIFARLCSAARNFTQRIATCMRSAATNTDTKRLFFQRVSPLAQPFYQYVLLAAQSDESNRKYRKNVLTLNASTNRSYRLSDFSGLSGLLARTGTR